MKATHTLLQTRLQFSCRLSTLESTHNRRTTHPSQWSVFLCQLLFLSSVEGQMQNTARFTLDKWRLLCHLSHRLDSHRSQNLFPTS